VTFAPGEWLILSTMTDMMVWLEFNMGLTDSPFNTLLSQLHTGVTPTQHGQACFGWFVTPDGKLWKDGVAEGYNSFIAIGRQAATASPAGVMVLTNQRLAKADVLANEVLKLLTGG
jgi:hypothetical protein